MSASAFSSPVEPVQTLIMDSNPYISYDAVLKLETQLDEARANHEIVSEALQKAQSQIKEMNGAKVRLTVSSVVVLISTLS